VLTPARFIGEAITVAFDTPPVLEKKPDCPGAFVWRDETFRVAELLEAWTDYARHGRSARNMQPQHATVAARRGSWGVGRFFFRVRVEDGRLFELYYDRAPKDSSHRKGAWFLRCELSDDSRTAPP
jgi:hypothetical protein